MSDGKTFLEIVALVPHAQRTAGIHVLTALWKLRIDGATNATGQITAFLRQHLRRKAPRNVSNVLARLSPLVERVQQDGERFRWRITESGLSHLCEVTGIDLRGHDRCTLDLSRLHPRVYSASKELFRNGHYSEAVGRAAKELNRLVRERTERNRDDGVSMMHEVF